MTPPSIFWNDVPAHVGDAYHPHSASAGIFLFREKLRRRGFDERMAEQLPASMLAKAVPWARFLMLGAREYLLLVSYGLPVRCHVCFDQQFAVYLIRCFTGTEDAGGETYQMVRLSLDRLAALEAGRMDLHDAFRHPEDCSVMRVEVEDAKARIIPAAELNEEELPPRGERMLPD